ncbi:hypothetical protein BGX38DRAFT_1162181 [Terfezia claveryi]|nr:hypothetical protein BGX38DRAFT_1162181 [Terfezia claveryi]
MPYARATQMGWYPMEPTPGQIPAQTIGTEMGIYPMGPIPAQVPTQASQVHMGMYPTSSIPAQGSAAATRAQMGMYPIPASQVHMGILPMAPIPAQASSEATRTQMGMHIMHTMTPTPVQVPAEVPAQDYHYSNTANSSMYHPVNMPTVSSVKYMSPDDFSRTKLKDFEQPSTTTTGTSKAPLGCVANISDVNMSLEDHFDRYITALIEKVCFKIKESVPSQGPFNGPDPLTTYNALDQKSEFTQAKRPRECNTSQGVGAQPPKRQRTNSSETSDPVKVLTRNKSPAPPVTAEILAYVRSRPAPLGCVKPQAVFRETPPLPTVPWSFDRDISYLDQAERVPGDAVPRHELGRSNASTEFTKRRKDQGEGRQQTETNDKPTHVAASTPTKLGHRPYPRQAAQLPPLQLPTVLRSPTLSAPSRPTITPSPTNSDHRSPKATPALQPLLLPTPIPSKATPPTPNSSTALKSATSSRRSSGRTSRTTSTTTSTASNGSHHGSRCVQPPPVAFTGTLVELMKIIRQREPLVANLLEEWMAVSKFSGDTPTQLLEAISERCRGVVEDTFKRLGIWIPRPPKIILPPEGSKVAT